MGSNQSPICEICTGWYQETSDGKYLKCRSCGHMKLVSKREITPIDWSSDVFRQRLFQ